MSPVLEQVVQMGLGLEDEVVDGMARRLREMLPEALEALYGAATAADA